MPPHPGGSREPDARAVTLDVVIGALEAAQGGHVGARRRAIDQLDLWLTRGYEPPQPAREEARLIAAARWMLNDQPDHPVIPVWAARAPHVLGGLDDKPLSALLAGFLFEYSIRNGNFGEAGRLVVEMWDRTASNWNARLAWLPSAALYLWLSGRADAALAALAPAFEDTTMAPALRYALLEQAASASLAMGDPARCLEYLGSTAALGDALSAQDRANVAFLRAGAAAASGDVETAREQMRLCDEHARGVDARFFRALWRLGAAVVRVKGGQERQAERELTELLGDVVQMRARYLEWSVRLARAAARLALGRCPPAEADLAAALRIAADNGYVNCDPWGLTPRLRALLGVAIERGIEVQAARAILAHRAA